MNNQQPNSEDRKGVNTRGLQLYNSDPLVLPPSTVVFGFWDDKYLSIKMHPGKANPTDKEKFDYDSGLNTAVNTENVLHLIDGLEAVKEAHLKGENASCFCIISNIHLFGYGTRHTDKGDIFYLAIHKELSQETRKPKASMYFEFPKPGFHIENYNPETGENELVYSKFGQFEIFENYLREAKFVATKATAHSTRFVFDYMLRRLDAKVSGIMTATNATAEYQPSYSRGYGARANVFGTNSSEKSEVNSPISAASDGIDTHTVTESEELPF